MNTTTTFVLKSIKQSYVLPPLSEIGNLMEAFRRMVNDGIRYGLRTGVSSLKRLSCLSYGELKQNYSSIPSYYRLTAISKAAGILAARKKSVRRGIKTRTPYLRKPLLVS